MQNCIQRSVQGLFGEVQSVYYNTQIFAGHYVHILCLVSEHWYSDHGDTAVDCFLESHQTAVCNEHSCVLVLCEKRIAE